MEQYTLTELKYHVKAAWTENHDTRNAQNGVGSAEEMILKTARYLLSGRATPQEIERAKRIHLFRALLNESSTVAEM